MKRYGAFDVVADGDGWYWRLRDLDVRLGVAPERYDDDAAARSAVDTVRRAAAECEAETDAADAAFRVTGGTTFGWVLERGDEPLATAEHRFETRDDAAASMARFRWLAARDLPVYRRDDRPGVVREAFEVDGLGSIETALRGLVGRGDEHRERLAAIDARIAVTGTRGKSSTVRRLNDVFARRGYETLAKITGDQPVVLRNDDRVPLERTGPYTTLYENVEVLRAFGSGLERYDNQSAMVFENQGITPYTTRLFNERFVDPHVVVLTNVRQDHRETLGETPRDIARAFARSVPPAATVVNAEQNPTLASYVDAVLEQRGVTVRRVDVPEERRGQVGAETAYAVNETLRAVDEAPVSRARLDEYLDAIQPTWVELPGGRVFDGAAINDVESTETVRRALARDDPVLPFVFLRGDRRGRTAAFADYLNTLADRDLVPAAHACGTDANQFAARVDVPVTRHDADESPAAVLDDLLAHDRPVFLMGNTVDDFMRELTSEIARRRDQVAADADEWPVVAGQH